MKKSLVVTLALVFVLGIAGSAFAASNPFVDVPAKHWAYDAVSKLGNAGIVDGFGDGTFRGDKTMTRYEMAQIVAKAMAKSEKADAETKALVDKLAVEFSAELDNLGVRVSKLEKKMGNVQWGGDARIRWNNATEGKDTQTQDRLRLNFKADINDQTSISGKFLVKRHNEFGNVNKDDDRIAESAITVKDFFGTTLTAGRHALKLGATGYFLDSYGMVDGAKVQFGNQVKVTAGYADFAPATGQDGLADLTIGEAYFINADLKASKNTTVTAMYIEEKSGSPLNYEVFGLGFNTKFNKNFAMNADYIQNTAQNDDPTAYVARVFYKGANKANVGSWGAIAEYDKWETGSFVNWNDYANASLLPIHDGAGDGNEFVGLTVQYTPAKNIVLSAFQTFNVKSAISGVEKDKLTKLQADFYF